MNLSVSVLAAWLETLAYGVLVGIGLLVVGRAVARVVARGWRVVGGR